MWRRAACAAARSRLAPSGHSYTCGHGALQACVRRSWSHTVDRPRAWPTTGVRRASNAAEASAADNPYKVLDLDTKASAEEIKAAYRRLALKWHPDRNRDNQAKAEEQFKRVSKAYSLLSDPQQREDFDRFGYDPQNFASQRASPVTEEEAQRIFRQMFGNKPLHEIIREVEMAFDQQQKQMQQKELELRDKARQLRSEAEEMQMRAHLASQTQLHRKANQIQQLALQKALEADRAEQELQASVLQHTMERVQQSSVRRRLQRLDPTERALNLVRLGIAWFVSLTAYFFWGWSILGSVFAYIIASNCARLTFVLLRALRGVKRP